MFKIVTIVIITLVITHFSLQTQVLCNICSCSNDTVVCKKIPIRIDKRFLNILSHVSTIRLDEVKLKLRLIGFEKLKQLELNKVNGLIRTPNLINSFELKEVTIRNSQLKVISKDLCLNKCSLHKIVLSENDINGIALNTFKKCQSLKLLDLSHNKLTSLKFLRQVSSNLLNLNLDSNMIRALLPYEFAHLSSLVELSLANNRIEYIGQTAFDGLKSLSKLNLRNNNIRKLPYTSQIYPHLNELYLGENRNLILLPEASQFELIDHIEVPFKFQCDSFDTEISHLEEISNIIIDDIGNVNGMKKCFWKNDTIIV